MINKLRIETRNARILHKVHVKIKKNRHKKIRVIFMCQYKPGWGLIKNVFNKMLESESFEPYIFALPYNQEDFPKNPEYKFWNTKTNNIINSVDNGKWTDLRKYEPDYIFIQRPYDNYLPPEFSVENLYKQYSLCYIPYGNSLWTGYELNSPKSFTEKVRLYYVQNQETKDHLDAYNKIINKLSLRKNYLFGYPVYDTWENNKYGDVSAFSNIKENKSYLKFLWTPRWTSNSDLIQTNFFKYKDKLIDYIKNNDRYCLVFRPHPMMFDNYIKTGEMTKKEVDDYLINFKHPRMVYDDNATYNSTFADSDMLITDFSSIVAEYLILNKPIIFCNKDTSLYNKTMMKILDCSYVAESFTDIKKWIKQLTNGEDSKQRSREILTRELYPYNNIAEKICESIIKDYKKLI